VIRLVTLDRFDEADIAFLCRTLFQAYGLGTEHVGDRSLPSEAEKADGRYDAPKLIAEVDPVKTFADDKIVLITTAPLSVRPGPLGEPPCYSYSDYGGERAVFSTARLPQRGVTEASVEAYRRRLAREAVHATGHLWDVHHCYDARCAMHPSWSPALPEDPSYDLCNFCREKSERKIRLSKT
jgi:archaemetzincin